MFLSFSSSMYPSLFAELDDALTPLGRGSLPPGPWVIEISGISGDETDVGQPLRPVCSKRA